MSPKRTLFIKDVIYIRSQKTILLQETKNNSLKNDKSYYYQVVGRHEV